MRQTDLIRRVFDTVADDGAIVPALWRLEVANSLFAVRHVNARGKHVFEVMDNAGILKQAYARIRRDFDQDVDVAVGAVVAARDRTEQRGMGDALRPQVGLALPELLYDLVAFHDALCSRKAPDFTAEPGTQNHEQFCY